MTARIAHISDIHHERLDQGVSDRLTEALAIAHPDFLVVTGDFVDNFWKLSAAKQWVLRLCDSVGIDPNTRLLTVPGNHDYRVLGNVGYRPITGHWYRKHFEGSNKSRIVLHEEFGICFIRIDSNPAMRGLARGTVNRRQLKAIENEIAALSDADRRFFSKATKIALVHHHPLPVPYEGSDTFLILNKAQNLIQFLAEHKVDCILHGHKHRAPHSIVCVGTCAGTNRTIEVVGAGTAVAGGPDHEARGHNFNLITVEDSGLMFVQQFFAQGGEAFREEVAYPYVGHALGRVYERAVAAGHKYKRIDWFVQINEEGDGLNEITYSQLTPTTPNPISFVGPFNYTCDTGHLSEARLIPHKTSAGVTLVTDQAKRRSRNLEFTIHFEGGPTAQRPVDFGIRCLDFNSLAVNEASFRRKYPSRAGRPASESEEKELKEVTEHFSMTLLYPPGYKLDHPPSFEILGPEGGVHSWLSTALQPAFHFCQQLGICSLSVHKPPIGYSYRVAWQLPRDGLPPESANPAHAAVVERFAGLMLNLSVPSNSQLRKDVEKVMDAFAHLVANYINALLHTSATDFSQIEVSVMAYDARNPTEPPKLRIAAGTHAATDDFALEIGDGNAGRAYSGNKYRIFDAELAQRDLIYETYVAREGRQPHHFLYSIPLRHPESPHLIFGVLNVGTFVPAQGRLLKSLNTSDESNAWLLEQAHSYVLRRLRELANITD